MAALLSFAALRERDAGAWFGKSFAGERIPSFEEVIELLAALGLGANVEIKPAAGQEEETARVAVALLRQYWPRHLPAPLVSSFASAALAASRAAISSTASPPTGVCGPRVSAARRSIAISGISIPARRAR
jgi:glycerophosphoryl diester phosphodiesterase